MRLQGKLALIAGAASGIGRAGADIFMGRPDVQADKAENLARVKQVISMGCVGTPMEVARAELFLVSDEASDMTGVALPVGGGDPAR